MFGTLLQEYYVTRFRENLRLRKAKLDALKTAADAEKYVAEKRELIRKIYAFPDEKCPLRLRVTGEWREPGYTGKKVLFDSRPDFPVSGILLTPEKRKTEKVPGILFLMGHSIPTGKAAHDYITMCISLCLKGCVVLGVDPIGQGERIQHPGCTAVSGCSEHNLFHRKMMLLGDGFGAWRIYDAVRSLDLLLSCPETDPDRIGVTGTSGGGTLTSLLGAVDDRIAAEAPGCYMTRWLRNAENGIPADGEQIPFGLARDGGEMGDMLIAAAPRPLRILCQKNDFFDIRGTHEVYEELKKIYALLGKPENLSLSEGPADHGYSIHNREAAYDFFNTVFSLGPDSREPEFRLPAPEELRAAPDGLTLRVPGSLSLDRFLARRAEELASARKPLPEEKLKTYLREKLGTGPVSVPPYRRLRPEAGENGVVFSRFGVEPEEHIVLPLFLAEKGRSFYHLPDTEKAVLYLPDRSARQELAALPLPEEYRLFGLDYRNMGEAMPEKRTPWTEDVYSSYNWDYFYSALSLLFGESLLGKQVSDVLAVIRLLRSTGVRELILNAAGNSVIPALLAAFLCEDPVRLHLKELPVSWTERVKEPVPELLQSQAPAGILKVTDLDVIQRFLQEAGKLCFDGTAKTHESSFCISQKSEN